MNSEIAQAVAIVATTQGVGFAVLALALGIPYWLASIVALLPVTLLVAYSLDASEADQAADPHAEVET